jgi:hypothetical protein
MLLPISQTQISSTPSNVAGFKWDHLPWRADRSAAPVARSILIETWMFSTSESTHRFGGRILPARSAFAADWPHLLYLVTASLRWGNTQPGRGKWQV